MIIGVIGVGYWGIKHVEEYIKLGHNVIVFDPLKKNLDICRKKFKVKIAHGYDEILENADIKYLSICTPNSTHYDLGKKAILKKKNVLIEKPLTTNSKKALELHHLALRNNVKLMSGHIFRFNNGVKKLRKIVIPSQLGKIYQIRCEWHQMTTIMRDKNIILDIGFHPLDIIHNIFDSLPNKISINSYSFRNNFAENVILNFFIKTKNYSKIHVMIDLSWITPIRKRLLTIIGSKKTIQLDCSTQQIKQFNNKLLTDSEIKITSNNTLQDELNYFLTSKFKDLMFNDEIPNGKVSSKILKTIELIKII